MKKAYKSRRKSNRQNSLDNKLNAYLKEEPIKLDTGLRSSAKGSLALLTTIAASALMTGDLNAQCQYPLGNGVLVDVDGDDIADIFIGTSIFATDWQLIYATPVGTASGGGGGLPFIGSPAPYYSANIIYPYAVANTATFGPGTTAVSAPVAILFLNYYNAPYGNFPPGTTASIPINVGGTTAFIEITVTGNTTFNVGLPLCASFPLPVELKNFDLEVKDQAIDLNWITAQEINNSGFQIERSIDGRNFNKIGWVEAAVVNETSETAYTFVDSKAKANVNYYYRLKQIDLDGNFSYSNVIQGQIDGKEEIIFNPAFPNPALSDGSEITIEIGSQIEENLDYVIFDIYGKQIRSGSSQLASGLNKLQIEKVGLAAGTYFIKMTAGEYASYQNFVIN